MVLSTRWCLTIQSELPPGRNVSTVHDGSRLAGVAAGGGFALHAPSSDVHSASQYAEFFVNFEAGGRSGVLGGAIAP
jgi:hypothetical protein